MEKKPTTEQQAEYQAKRAALTALTGELMPVAKAAGVTVNSLIVETYAQKVGCKPFDFSPFAAWKERGYKVKKGEKGFPIWSRPRDIIKAEQGKPVGDEPDKFFGLSYLFHFGQVEKIENSNP